MRLWILLLVAIGLLACGEIVEIDASDALFNADVTAIIVEITDEDGEQVRREAIARDQIPQSSTLGNLSSGEYVVRILGFNQAGAVVFDEQQTIDVGAGDAVLLNMAGA